MSLQHLEALNPQIEDPDFILPGWKVNLGSGGSGMPTHSSYANSGEPVAHADPAPGAVGNSNNSVSEDPVNKAAAALGHDHGGHEGDKIVPAKPIG